MSALSLKSAPKTYPTPDLLQLSSIDSTSSTESVIRGIIGSIFTPQFMPASVNLLMIENIWFAGGVPGSIIRLIFSLHVVIDQTKKQLSLYLWCKDKSLDI